MTLMPPGVRNLFRAALVLFVITVVIGILNGTDVWEPGHDTLMTHVHAGTLGWITLAVFGAAIWMFAEPGEDSGPLASYSIVAMAAYVLAFWSVELTAPTTFQRPIGGALALIAIGWLTYWIFRSKRGESWTVAELGMGLASVFLLIGAILGIALGLQLADVEIVAPENTESLAGAHPAAMVIGYVILAAIAISEWMLEGDQARLAGNDRLGVAQMALVFLAGLFGMLGLLLEIDPLIQLNVPLEVIGIGIVLWRLRAHLVPSAWHAGPGRFVRTALIGLIPTVLLTALLVQQFVSGAEFSEFQHILVALDHSTFLLVATNLIVAMLLAGSVVSDTSSAVMYYGIQIGSVGFVVGLLAQSDVIKRVFTLILGLILLHAIFSLLMAPEREEAASSV